jgi:5-methylcytosine-specific restriction protein A
MQPGTVGGGGGVLGGGDCEQGAFVRNPHWTRDELVLALELFFRVNPLHTSESNLEIVVLSEVLNRLPLGATVLFMTNAGRERNRIKRCGEMRSCGCSD